jgi:hypothetical protein
MSAVTHSRKCYRPVVFVCAACDGLADGRRDQTTCSSACRVRLHRHPEQMQRLREDAERAHITPAMILQGAACYRLRPDLADDVLVGTRTLADIAPEIWRAYWAAVCAAAGIAKATPGLLAPCEADV